MKNIQQILGVCCLIIFLLLVIPVHVWMFLVIIGGWTGDSPAHLNRTIVDDVMRIVTGLILYGGYLAFGYGSILLIKNSEKKRVYKVFGITAASIFIVFFTGIVWNFFKPL